MEEKLFYPSVALLYFLALSWESRGDRLILGTVASLNVFCLFMVAQPICVMLGGLQGALIYIALAVTSYVSLPRKEQPREKTARRKEQKSTITAKRDKDVGKEQ